MVETARHITIQYRQRFRRSSARRRTSVSRLPSSRGASACAITLPFSTGTISGILWEGKIEGRAFLRLALRPYPPAVPGQDPLHDGETDADTAELLLGMHALKYSEQPVVILHGKSDAVVLDAIDVLGVPFFCADFDQGPLPYAAEFEGVVEDPHPHLLDQQRVAARGRERINRQLRASVGLRV